MRAAVAAAPPESIARYDGSLAIALAIPSARASGLASS